MGAGYRAEEAILLDEKGATSEVKALRSFQVKTVADMIDKLDWEIGMLTELQLVGWVERSDTHHLPETRRIVADCSYGFRPYGESLSLCARKEKVTKEKARPAYGFRCAQLPSLRRCSEGRHGGPSLAHRSSVGIHAKRPSTQHLHSAS